MITTFQQHVLQEQARFPGATSEFSWLVSGLTLATKMIESQVRRAGLLDVQPVDIHQRTPLVVGGPVEMEEFERCAKEG